MMKNALYLSVVFLAGLASGWWLRDDQERVSAEIPASVEASQASGALQPGRTPAARDTMTTPSTTETMGGKTASFAALLHAGRFAAAADHYFNALSATPERVPRLRDEFDGYVENCLRTCPPAQFMDLAETWLDTFYNDIPMLLSLAQFQSLAAQPEAAANTLLLARTYARAGTEQQRVEAAVRRLAEDTDKVLSRERRWIELLGFYEFLSELDLSGKELRLRQAQLHNAIGEQTRAERILRSLLAEDSGTDPRWTAMLQGQLPTEQEPETLPSATTADALPLERRRDHYLVSVEINDSNDLTLMIDTGASVTTVSSERFRTLPRQDFELLGSRIFNTANGYTRGDVYRARSLRIGPHRLENTVVAVLPFQPEGDADGLLGMDVLRYFRFEIDQDRAALLLEPR